MIVKEKISTKKNINHIIFNDKPNNARSLASYMLLINYYQDLDVSFSEENDWRYYFIVRRHFLRKKKKENGGFWVCHYCGKIMTKIQKRNTKWIQPWCVTVDHIIPQSDPNCDKLDTSNMVECCSKCNVKKGTTPYAEFHRQKTII
jgi:5-methylcytosine-specific restriction endonuclease McrA